MNELISVIVPVYNMEKYLEKCVDSIINQTYKNIEIILIDDGSKDNSGTMCDELAKKDNRIKVIHKKNAGLSAARNDGIKIANGEYVCFVDSDDYVTEDYCEVLYNTLIDTNADISAIAYREIRDDGIPILDADEKNKTKFNNQRIIYDGDDIIIQMLKWETFRNMAWNKLYKTDMVRKHLFLEGYAFEDIYFSYEILSDINRITYINTPCYYYVRRTNSISLTCSEKNLNDFLDVVIMKYKGIKEKYLNLSKYNVYALLESTVSISIKYVASGEYYKEIEEKLDFAFNELKNYTEEEKIEFTSMLSDLQKICLYLIRFDKELFFKFLKMRQN